jgi:hypothetical protein
MMITRISLCVFVYHSNGTGMWDLTNHNVPEMCGILEHPAILLLLFVMYHRPLAAYPYI